MRRVACLTVISCALAASAIACSEEEAPPSRQGVGDPLPLPPPREIWRDPIYGPDGVPRESDERVAGLVLPLGLEEIEELRRERRHVYGSQVPPHKMLRYFGPRLNTVRIDRTGDQVTYRDAVPQGVRGGIVKLDVTIEPTSSHPTRVTIIERPPPLPEGTVVTDEAIREYFDTLDPARRE